VADNKRFEISQLLFKNFIFIFNKKKIGFVLPTNNTNVKKIQCYISKVPKNQRANLKIEKIM